MPMINSKPNSAEESPEDQLRKKLIFRAWHRGTREMDILIGRFAQKHVPELTAQQLTAFEELLKENDPDIYDWVLGRTAIPSHVYSDVAQMLCDFYKAG